MEPKLEFPEIPALALLYLCSWKEKDSDLRSARKSIDFTVLDALQEKGLIHFSRTAKSLYLTKEEEKKAEQAVAKLKPAFAS